MSDEHAAGAEHTHHSHAHAGHHHAHHHAHAHGGSFADENARHYDAAAQEYDARPDVQELARRVAAAIQKLHPALLDGALVSLSLPLSRRRTTQARR